MTNKMRRDYQRKFNKKMRELNQNIMKDDLWRGRFVFLQKDAQWSEFADHSGGILIAWVRAYDKQTGYYHDYHIEYAPWMTFFNWHLTMDVGNKFIVEHADVWRNDDSRPSIKTAIDYTKIKVDVAELMRKPSNHYINYVRTGEWADEVYA
jgi:hypothetical protein